MQPLIDYFLLMASETVEDYLKQIYLLSQGTKDGRVSTGGLATAIGVVPGTATSMVKTLADGGLVHYEPRGGVKLSRGGEKLALHVLRRHRLIELLLVNVIGLDWSEVHPEAERLEHAISDKVLDKIDSLLGHPSVDPHGDPIPTAAGTLLAGSGLTLRDAPVNRPLSIVRVLDQNEPFLKFARDRGLTPGRRLKIAARDASSDAITLSIGREETTLGSTAAAKFVVAAVKA